MNEICRAIIEHPSAWTVPSLGGKAGLMRPVSAEELKALEAFCVRTRSKRAQDITRQDFSDPVLARMCDDFRERLMEGRGSVIVAGISPEIFSPEDYARITQGIGTQLGEAAVQSYSGDRLGYVQQDTTNPTDRGYKSDRELTFHTDSYEIVGLMCVRSAFAGGYSQLISSITLHNEILKTRPDLLEPLYEGYYYALKEIEKSERPLTDTKIPIFCCVDGRVSLTFNDYAIENAARLRGEPLPPKLAEAKNYLQELCERSDLCLQFLLEPGEMLLWHNFMNIHSRTSFEDSAEKQRLLLRLWLTVPNGRKVHRAFHDRAAAYDAVFPAPAKAS